MDDSGSHHWVPFLFSPFFFFSLLPCPVVSSFAKLLCIRLLGSRDGVQHFQSQVRTSPQIACCDAHAALVWYASREQRHRRELWIRSTWRSVVGAVAISSLLA